MLDINMIIANNIQNKLKKENKKQIDLAERICVSRQTMSKIMNGSRAINAVELQKVSAYLHVPMETLIKMPENSINANVIAVYGVQRSLFRFRTAAFRNITVVLQQSLIQVNGKGLSRHGCPIDLISECLSGQSSRTKDCSAYV